MVPQGRAHRDTCKGTTRGERRWSARSHDRVRRARPEPYPPRALVAPPHAITESDLRRCPNEGDHPKRASSASPLRMAARKPANAATDGQHRASGGDHTGAAATTAQHIPDRKACRAPVGRNSPGSQGWRSSVAAQPRAAKAIRARRIQHAHNAESEHSPATTGLGRPAAPTPASQLTRKYGAAGLHGGVVALAPQERKRKGSLAAHTAASQAPSAPRTLRTTTLKAIRELRKTRAPNGRAILKRLLAWQMSAPEKPRKKSS